VVGRWGKRGTRPACMSKIAAYPHLALHTIHAPPLCKHNTNTQASNRPVHTHSTHPLRLNSRVASASRLRFCSVPSLAARSSRPCLYRGVCGYCDFGSAGCLGVYFSCVVVLCCVFRGATGGPSIDSNVWGDVRRSPLTHPAVCIPFWRVSALPLAGPQTPKTIPPHPSYTPVSPTPPGGPRRPD
jgi:hypothetical protein